MDTIAFKKFIIELDYSDKEYAGAIILINGRPLIDLVRDYELPYARECGQESIAGGYMPIYADYLLDLLTGKTKSEEYDGEIPVLICECGCEGCWDLLATVVEEESSFVPLDHLSAIVLRVLSYSMAYIVLFPVKQISGSLSPSISPMKATDGPLHNASLAI